MSNTVARAIDQSSRELHSLHSSLIDEGLLFDLTAERIFRQRLQSIADCCRDMPDVMTAWRAAQTASVFAFALPARPEHVETLQVALRALAASLTVARNAPGNS